jgi:hypothetical protein
MTPEIFAKLEISDLRLYYNNTFARIKQAEDEKFQWAYIDEFGTSEQNTPGVVVRDENNAQRLISIKKIKWDFTIPPSGAYNFKNSVILFFRFPVRQSIKGLAKSNTVFINLMRDVMFAGAIPPTFYEAHDFSLCAKTLNLLFENTAPLSFEFGLEKIARKQALAFAINSRISLSQGVISKSPSIWLKNRLIGELDLKTEMIYPLHTAFVPELIETFVDKGFIVKQN